MLFTGEVYFSQSVLHNSLCRVEASEALGAFFRPLCVSIGVVLSPLMFWQSCSFCKLFTVVSECSWVSPTSDYQVLGCLLPVPGHIAGKALAGTGAQQVGLHGLIIVGRYFQKF